MKRKDRDKDIDKDDLKRAQRSQKRAKVDPALLAWQRRLEVVSTTQHRAIGVAFSYCSPRRMYNPYQRTQLIIESNMELLEWSADRIRVRHVQNAHRTERMERLETGWKQVQLSRSGHEWTLFWNDHEGRYQTIDAGNADAGSLVTIFGERSRTEWMALFDLVDMVPPPLSRLIVSYVSDVRTCLWSASYSYPFWLPCGSNGAGP
jgi:hypothetical protein